MAKKSTRKSSTRNTATKAAVKKTVNNMTEKTEAAVQKETPVAKVEEKAAQVKETVAAKATEAKEAVTAKAAEAKEAVTAKATEAKKVVAAKAEEVKEATMKAKEEVKETVTKAEAPKKRGRKPAAEKKETTAKTVKKPAAKKADKFVPEIFLQYREFETEQTEVVERIKAQYVAEGHRVGNIKSLKVYIKPEDGAAYYVINDKTAGRVNLF